MQKKQKRAKYNNYKHITKKIDKTNNYSTDIILKKIETVENG